MAAVAAVAGGDVVRVELGYGVAFDLIGTGERAVANERAFFVCGEEGCFLEAGAALWRVNLSGQIVPHGDEHFADVCAVVENHIRRSG